MINKNILKDILKLENGTYRYQIKETNSEILIFKSKDRFTIYQPSFHKFTIYDKYGSKLSEYYAH